LVEARQMLRRQMGSGRNGRKCGMHTARIPPQCVWSEPQRGLVSQACGVSIAGLAHGRSDCWELSREKPERIGSVALFLPLMS
jgi:hypothetical protein